MKSFILCTLLFTVSRAFALPSLPSLFQIDGNDEMHHHLQHEASRASKPICSGISLNKTAGCGCFVVDRMNKLPTVYQSLCQKTFDKPPTDMRQMCLSGFYNSRKDIYKLKRLKHVIATIDHTCLDGTLTKVINRHEPTVGPTLPPRPALRSSSRLASSRSARLLKKRQRLHVASRSALSIVKFNIYLCGVLYKIRGVPTSRLPIICGRPH